jgi:GntR family transcriptional repressor for pyruvate dehydrogenase complex
MSSPNGKAGSPRRSRPVQVADRIKDWVVERDLKTGARLPNEAEMILQFGVSKGTVREAMRILEAQGLIVTRTGPGGGSFVGEVTAERARRCWPTTSTSRNFRSRTSTSFANCWSRNFRPSLAGRLSREQLDRLRDLATRFDRPRHLPEEERDQHVVSLRFHETLAEFGDNPLLGFMRRPSWRGC